MDMHRGKVGFIGAGNMATALVKGIIKSGLYSRERVFQGNPDVIIITTMGLVGEEEKAVWQNYPALNAVQTQRIYIVDEYQFCSMSPEDFLQALEKMVEILHQNAPKSI